MIGQDGALTGLVPLAMRVAVLACALSASGCTGLAAALDHGTRERDGSQVALPPDSLNLQRIRGAPAAAAAAPLLPEPGDIWSEPGQPAMVPGAAMRRVAGRMGGIAPAVSRRVAAARTQSAFRWPARSAAGSEGRTVPQDEPPAMDSFVSPKDDGSAALLRPDENVHLVEAAH